MKFDIIGISDARQQWFPPQVQEVITSGSVFSGGRRHHEIVGELLPADATWIDITVPLSSVFEQYRQHPYIVAFASGDPLFFGFATTLQREFPEAELRVFPSFHSLQTLAHRLCLPYHDMQIVSLTGRPWQALDTALIRGERLIGILTDTKEHTPQGIAARMVQYGYDSYAVSVGECLGNEQTERITRYDSPSQLLHSHDSHAAPNCIILQRTNQRKRQFGIPESEFELLDGRVNMITKAPIRLASLAALDLANRHTLWDIGFCTGSVSIEARLQFPHLAIEAFEVRPECERIIQCNMERFGAPGISIHTGDFLAIPTAELHQLPPPDAVFIGGHSGQLIAMVERLLTVASPGTCIVLNAVSERSIALFQQAIEWFHLRPQPSQRIALDDHNPIVIMKATI